jgi:hypothetical protein
MPSSVPSSEVLGFGTSRGKSLGNSTSSLNKHHRFKFFSRYKSDFLPSDTGSIRSAELFTEQFRTDSKSYHEV